MPRPQPDQPKHPFDPCLAQEALRIQEQAKTLPHGQEPERLSRKTRQVETASHISEWISSPGRQPPR